MTTPNITELALKAIEAVKPWRGEFDWDEATAKKVAAFKRAATPEAILAMRNEVLEESKRLAEEWRCRNCHRWFQPNESCGCDRPSWQKQRTPEEMILALDSLKTRET